MKKIMITGLVVVFLLVTASSLQAQKLYIGGLLGYSMQDLEVPTLEFDQDNSLFYGGMLGLSFMGFAIEAQYMRSDYDIVQTVSGIVDWDGETLEYQYIGANLKFTPISVKILKLYLTAGYGSYTTDISNVGKDSDWSWNAGAGIELRFSKLGIVFEGRYRPGDVLMDGQPLDLGNYSLGLGILLYF
jgi:hypothetical protein